MSQWWWWYMVLLASLSLSAAAGGHGRHLRSWKSKRKRHGGYGRVDMAMFARPEFLRWIADQPEVDYNAVELIQYYGFPVETHTVQTDDGYILVLHRIPHGRADSSQGHGSAGKTIHRPVVFVMHGFLTSDVVWLTENPRRSLVYMLANAGFDVWLGNIRGNGYSNSHILYPTDSKLFWNFSVDEHALIDLPTMINYVLKTTGEKQLIYVGYSQGTQMAFAGFTANKTLARSIKLFFGLAPVATLRHVRGAFNWMASMYPVIRPMLDTKGNGQVAPSSGLLSWMSSSTCFISPSIQTYLCGNMLFLVTGFNAKPNINMTRLMIYYKHTSLGGTSVKNTDHYVQGINLGRFQMFDYGSDSANAQYYSGMLHPPAYNVSELSIPTVLFSGGQDWLANPRDVKTLLASIHGNVIYYRHIPHYAHFDFIWGLDAWREIYTPVIRIMRKMLSHRPGLYSI